MVIHRLHNFFVPLEKGDPAENAAKLSQSFDSLVKRDKGMRALRK